VKVSENRFELLEFVAVTVKILFFCAAIVCVAERNWPAAIFFLLAAKD
jgi:hypothetical protein